MSRCHPVVPERARRGEDKTGGSTTNAIFMRRDAGEWTAAMVGMFSLGSAGACELAPRQDGVLSMRVLMRGLLALSLVMGAVVPGQAQDLHKKPDGQWEIEYKDSRYQVELCGEDGWQLCATLIWLGNGADNKENLPYLNTRIIDHARPVAPNQWKGDLHLYGHTASGTITQVSDNQLSIQGCLLVVLCKTFQMYRMN
jgi:uncharacterized protein (DUF2147 family)